MNEFENSELRNNPVEEKKFFKRAELNQKVPLKEKLFFGAADLYGGGAQALITAVYLVFGE